MELENNKINWLSILQGWGMLLVVLGHVVLSNEFKNPDYPVTAALSLNNNSLLLNKLYLFEVLNQERYETDMIIQ
ncbi:MAG: hypothetical protein RR293_01865 [Bacteroidales bacterium]